MSIRFRGIVGQRAAARVVTLVLLPIAVVTSACGNGSNGSDTLRLGVFPNVTHAPGLAAIEGGFLDEALGEDIDLDVHFFNAGGEAIEAMFAGQIDLTYIGPNPAINGFQQSDGRDVRIVAGSTSGGAALVVGDDIDSVDDLAGTSLASPALGNTQDVALRSWLAAQGYETDPTGGGDVTITPLENPDILQAFQAGGLDGAWVPEPWATRLVDEAGGHVLVDEADLWPDGRFVTTHVLARTSFLEDNPDLVRSFLDGHLDALDFVNDNPAEAQETVLDAIEGISGTRLPEEVVANAWDNLGFTHDPIAPSLAGSAEDAVAVELLEPVDLDGIYDLNLLNELISRRGEDTLEGL